MFAFHGLLVEIVCCVCCFVHQAKRVSEALDLFGEMLEAGVKPNAVAVNSMLAACARDASDFWMHANTIFEVNTLLCRAQVYI